MRLPAIAAALLVFCAALAGCSSSGDDKATDNSSGTSSAGATSASGGGPVSCDYPKDSAAAAKKVDPPPAKPAVSGTVPVTISTSMGEISAELDADAAPCTVNSFVSLAKQGYFNDTPCHRLVTAINSLAVLQCGDPSGTGTGGPGYSFADELNGSETYPAGTLAMANGGPDTNGSQFFMVYADSVLTPNYTVFGHIDAKSVQIIAKTAALGTKDGSDDGAPKKPVKISAVTVK
jgi:peptidyl-prolyl cis-trans isomerase B (cyclophilin B)